jgi:ATP-dependent Clp protease ATP-binding subunit ClpB
MNEGVMDLIVERGYDPAFGARPLKRTIQQLLENPLSQKILAGEYTSGSTINAKVVNNEIAFS